MVAKASHQTKKFKHTGPKLREHGVGKMRQKSLNRYNFNQKAKIYKCYNFKENGDILNVNRNKYVTGPFIHCLRFCFSTNNN